MRILTIAPVPFFESRGTPISIFERLKILSKICDNIDVITYHVGRDIELDNVNINRIPDLKFIKRVPVGPSLVKLILDSVLTVKTFILLWRNTYSIIHSNEEGAILGAIFSKLFRIPHIYDFHSSLPDVLENFGYKRYLIFKSIFKFIERFTIMNSDAVISVSPALTDYIRTISRDIPVVTIENTHEAIDLSAVPRDEIEKKLKLYSINDKIRTVMYTGTFERYQGLDLLLMSAKLIEYTDQNVIFILVGGETDQVGHYRKKSLDLGLQNQVFFTGRIPQEEIPVFLSIADVLVSPRIRGMNPPLKIYTYLQCSKPIVATDIIAHTQVLNPDIAHLVMPEPSELSKGITYVLENEPYAKSIAKNAIDHYRQRYDQDSSAIKIKEILSQIAE